ASGAGDRKVVEVRVFFWAPIQASRLYALNLQEPAKAVFCIFGPCKCVSAITKTKTGVYRSKRAPYSAPHQQRQR
ncbi:hypothetical protein, partial [Pseudomonas alvandae]|uniref:hypothetical protein n=1 Tax=Pseudomonas canavaninivorans TaxID=2842348 RepID=UPI002B1E210E